MAAAKWEVIQGYQTSERWNRDDPTHRFSVRLFLGAGEFADGRCGDLDEAVAIKAEMEREYRDTNYGRRAIIYDATTSEMITVGASGEITKTKSGWA